MIQDEEEEKQRRRRAEEEDERRIQTDQWSEVPDESSGIGNRLHNDTGLHLTRIDDTLRNLMQA